jgi:preprotein translocase subunit Sec61beta
VHVNTLILLADITDSYLCNKVICFLKLSSKKKNAPLPASSAGLLRFFEDETKGIKIKPELVLGVTGALIAISILIRIIFPVAGA